MAISIETLGAARRYVNETLQGAGALKGQDGESAYQIALDNGFVGSQEEWLASLKGERGDNGLDGLNGQDGKDGLDGFSPTIIPDMDNTDEVYKLDITTRDYSFKTDNLKGERGLQGVRGEKGEPGAAGQQGIQGIKGDNGDTPYIKNGTWWYGNTDSGVPIPSFLDLLKYVDESYGIQDTPIGHIINHMGNNAPKHYLKCDGAIYNIGTYPYLEEHFTKEFGRVDYFGGKEAEGTYAVPNLQGEFLRGTGTTPYTNSGNGANVGVHQQATTVPNFQLNNTNGKLFLNNLSGTDYTGVSGSDKLIVGGTNENVVSPSYTKSTYTGQNPYSHFAVRPSNTSVLYCIKYEPTYFMIINGKE